MSHAFAARRGGHGVCAFCPETLEDGDHRELTLEERAAAQKVIDSTLEVFG